jgi:phage terminase large subunit GpA-like protein
VSKPKTTNFNSIGEIFCELAELLRPPERLTVSQAAAKYRYVNQPGAYVGPWLNETTPYMVEPMDTFAARTYRGMIFVGPAQSAKTDSLVLNTVSYAIKVDPMDTMVVCPTMTAARDFSIRRIDRLHRHSVAVGEKLIPGSANDNTFDKHYISGMLLSLSWPTPTELAGKPIGRVILTDRDRMPDDIDGDGEPFDLAAKRTTTFGSYAMTVAESSPSRPVKDLKWVAKTLHEAPPCDGILGLYNRGDRRRWYWPCPACNKYFEGMFSHLVVDENATGTNLEKAGTTRMICPHCDYRIHPDERAVMQEWGMWVKDGQGIDAKGRVFGPEPRTLIASFWLRGVAAAFTSWKTLMAMYLDANDDYERTGSEESLKKFWNNDLGEPYYPRSSMEGLRLPETLKARAEALGERVVPLNVRFLVALADVQKNMFVVSVFGIIPGKPFDMVVVDRFQVMKSHRLDDDGERLWVKPHAYTEDWDRLTEEVLSKEYPLCDDSGRMMQIKFTGCDSGGKEGVTTMAYTYYRRLRENNLHRRFILTKGDHAPNMPRTMISYPDSSRKDKLSAARGDVPVLRLNSNILKDDLNGRLDCMMPGRGMYRFPDWLSDDFYAELCAETRTGKGWENLAQARNEQWDLSYMCIGLLVSELIRIEVIDWDNPPGWAAEWDKNDLIRKAESPQRFANGLESKYDFAQFGAALA